MKNIFGKRALQCSISHANVQSLSQNQVIQSIINRFYIKYKVDITFIQCQQECKRHLYVCLLFIQLFHKMNMILLF